MSIINEQADESITKILLDFFASGETLIALARYNLRLA